MTALLANRFELGERLGAGAMGVIFTAVDRQLGRKVALKTLPVLEAEELAALKAEFRIRKELVHPNVVALYELFSSDERCFFTMERIAGRAFVDALATTVSAHEETHCRALVTQLLHGVAATHDAGIIHRDLKPDNLMVDGHERVVILDFGLAVRASQIEGSVSGTLAYMAPEALWGRASPASDWFSVGALLYEAVVGELPWSARDVSQRFLRVHAAAAVGRVAWPWLATLIDELLAIDVSARPTDDQLCDRFPDPRAGFTRRVRAPFVGRTDELKRLEAAFNQTLAGESCLVTLRGPSGAGKSSLLKHFSAGLRSRPDVALLHGSCHHSEHLPLAALDPLIDELASLLRAPALRQLLPDAPPLAAAARLFPTLGDLQPLSEAPTLLPTELRRQALTALRKFFGWLSGHVSIVIVIDDAQWGDEASATVLREIFDPREGVRALVLLGCRGGEYEGELLGSLRDWELRGGSSLVIDVGRLEDEEIAGLLRGSTALDEGHVDELVRRAEGSPFLALELVRSLQAAEFPPSGSSPVALLQHRLIQLGDAERRLAQVAALADRPLPRSIVLEAAGLTDGGLVVALALERNCVLAGFPGSEPQLGIYHDQIRRALLAELADEHTQALHGDLADALERAPRSDPERLLNHLLGAGRRDRAIDIAIIAAEEASARLVFDRAAVLLQRALDAGVTGARRIDILHLQGQAWRSAGIGAKAANSFESAAALSDVEAPDQSEPLWADAAEEMARHGRIDEGEAIFRRLLVRHHIRLPQRPGTAMALGLALRVRLWWRGFDCRIDDPSLTVADLARHELIYKAANSLSLTHFPLSFYLSGRLLIEALDRGNRLQLVRTLGSEAAFSAALGGPRFSRRAAELMKQVATLVAESDDPLLHAGLHSFRGLVAWNRGRFRETVVACDAFSSLVRRELPGRAWDLAVSDAHIGSALFHLGEVDALSARVPAAIAAARDRGDHFAVNQLRLGDSGSYLILRGEFDRVRVVLAEAEAELSLGPTIETYYYTLLRLRCELSEGHFGDAWATIERLWPVLEAGQLFAVEMARCLLHHLRGQALLGLLDEHPPPRARRRHERELRRTLATLHRTSVPQGAALAADLEARRLGSHHEAAGLARAHADEALRQAELVRLIRTSRPTRPTE